MISQGTFSAVARDAKLGVAGTGAEQVGVLFEITSEGPEKGNTITWYGYFSEKTIERTLEALRLLGWTGSDITKLDTIFGHEAAIVVEHETNNGKTAAKVKWVNRPGGGGIAMKDAMAPAAALTFAEKMKAKVAAFDARQAAAKPALPAAETKSSVPF